MEINFRTSIRVIGTDPRYNMTSVYPYGNWNYGVFRNNTKFEHKMAIIHSQRWENLFKQKVK